MGKGIKAALTLLLAILAWLLGTLATAQTIPPGAQEYAPLLAERQQLVWPDAPKPWTIAGLIEQESCVSLTHSRCWNPRAELKTSREYGFGFGQITVAYRADGTVRFNKFEELRAAHAALRDWTWEDRYDPGYQLTAVTEMTRGLFRRVKEASTDDDRWAFTLSGYNGGAGAVLQDRRYCGNIENCDPARWFGHVELNSLKSKVPQPGYGNRSWFDINRGHVDKVMNQRRQKYIVFWRF